MTKLLFCISVTMLLFSCNWFLHEEISLSSWFSSSTELKVTFYTSNKEIRIQPNSNTYRSLISWMKANRNGWSRGDKTKNSDIVISQNISQNEFLFSINTEGEFVTAMGNFDLKNNQVFLYKKFKPNDFDFIK
ncbi:MAG: hypothetical protein ACI8WT_005025 [Clostridium sp.]|jgi:hypothetical protein